ncbi:Putative UDP-glucose 4-epimerase [Planktothrix tepida]|uniref:NAD-dependent epimerase/dehydratase n=1 Tax=Planktothrix tepida PCC 9214 TaxID=671072 RepID=A0A1J1LTB5_9CYAN|nr:NAD-dependent epimerase/dehydratase family protein [Planktothrix tepida]CAD5962071.1 Putative UDP-glucose 4-epimerase [Planktothrix tepida]CUR34801.1 NAD-dependent epimerase/dehydratase [Planktothrix tepida PCC 9214]
MKTMLVTGGCGFIGSHLVDVLIDQGYQVIVLDDLSTGREYNLNDQAELIVGNITNSTLVNSIIKETDACFHLAAIASTQSSNQDWVGTHQVNLTGTINIFNVARRTGKRPIPVIYASSAAVYGNTEENLIDESYPKQPLTAYGADKLGCELHAKVAGNIDGVPTCGLRFFNVYGPRQDPSSPYSGVISIFANRILSNQSITIFGDGNQTRDFIFVSDVVRYLIAALNQATTEAPVFNVCTGERISIHELAQTAMNVAEQVVPILHQDPREGDIRYSIGNPKAAKDNFNITANITLQEGLSQLFKSFKSKTN